MLLVFTETLLLLLSENKETVFGANRDLLIANEDFLRAISQILQKLSGMDGVEVSLIVTGGLSGGNCHLFGLEPMISFTIEVAWLTL